MCQSGQGTTVLLIGYSANYLLLRFHAGITESQWLCLGFFRVAWLD
jgi:hypothetical protein